MPMPETLAHSTYRRDDWSLGLGRSDRGLCMLSLHDDGGTELARHARRFVPGARIVDDPMALRPVADQLDAYFAGELRTFDLPLDLWGTPFQVAVWRALADIPYGDVRTYAQLARAIDRPRAFRAVGQALHVNPVAIVVPCHRVTASAGIGGYGGGLPTKRRLLALEGAPAFA